MLCTTKSIVPLQTSLSCELHVVFCDLFNRNEWLPWLQTTRRDSSSGRFTLGLETNCIKQLGPDYLTGITTIILQILTTVMESPVAGHQGMKISMMTQL